MYVIHLLHVLIGELAFQVLTIAMLAIKRITGKLRGRVPKRVISLYLLFLILLMLFSQQDIVKQLKFHHSFHHCPKLCCRIRLSGKSHAVLVLSHLLLVCRLQLIKTGAT